MNLFLVILCLAVAALAVLALRARRPRALPHRRKLTALRLLRDNVGALLPAATTTLQETGAGVGLGTDLVCVLSVMEKGTDLSSGGVLQLYTKTADIQTTFGRGEGLAFVSHYVQFTGKPVLFGALKNVTAAVVSNVDTTGVTGTSIVTFTGTPFDDEEIQVQVVAGCTIGTVGGSIKYSRDGGRTWSATQRLGAATTFAIGDSGVTANFAAGTLVAGDVAKCFAISAKWDATAITSAFTALKSRTEIPRAVVVCGDVSSSAMLAGITAAIKDYETSVNRASRVFINFRDYLPKAVAQYGAATVTVAGSGPYTYTRSTGSYVTDGFQVGTTVVFSGFVNPANNGSKTITAVTATVLTVTETSTAESLTANTKATATELDSQWQTALEVLVGSTPATQIISHKTATMGGRGRRLDPLNGFFKRRPAMWWEISRWMSIDVKSSPGRVQDGGLDGVTITDLNGNTEDHDERSQGGLLAMRIGCLRTFAEVGISGVYVALPLTLDNDNAPMSRVQVGGVADIAYNIVQAKTAQLLQSGVDTKPDGTITEAEAKRIEQTVLSELKRQLLVASLGGNDPGPRCSSVSFRLDRTVNITVPGAQVPTETDLESLGYFEQFTNRIVVNKPAS